MYPAALHKFQPNQLIRHKFLRGEFSKSKQYDQQNNKKLGQKHNQLCPKQAQDFLS